MSRNNIFAHGAVHLSIYQYAWNGTAAGLDHLAVQGSVHVYTSSDACMKRELFVTGTSLEKRIVRCGVWFQRADPADYILSLTVTCPRKRIAFRRLYTHFPGSISASGLMTSLSMGAPWLGGPGGSLLHFRLCLEDRLGYFLSTFWGFGTRTTPLVGEEVEVPLASYLESITSEEQVMLVMAAKESLGEDFEEWRRGGGGAAAAGERRESDADGVAGGGGGGGGGDGKASGGRTPLVLPVIIAVDTVLTEEEVNALAATSSASSSKAVGGGGGDSGLESMRGRERHSGLLRGGPGQGAGSGVVLRPRTGNSFLRRRKTRSSSRRPGGEGSESRHFISESGYGPGGSADPESTDPGFAEPDSAWRDPAEEGRKAAGVAGTGNKKSPRKKEILLGESSVVYDGLVSPRRRSKLGSSSWLYGGRPNRGGGGLAGGGGMTTGGGGNGSDAGVFFRSGGGGQRRSGPVREGGGGGGIPAEGGGGRVKKTMSSLTSLGVEERRSRQLENGEELSTRTSSADVKEEWVEDRGAT